jgi:hypothetical protein
MLFTRKPKQTLVSTVKSDIVSTEAKLSTKDKIFSKALAGAMTLTPVGLATAINFEGFHRLMTLNTGSSVIVFGTAFAVTSLMGITLLKSFLKDVQEDAIIESLGDSAVSKPQVRKAVKASKKDRTLVASFNILEAVEANIDSWRKAPETAIPVEEATHTVKHFLIKEKKGYRLEQEVTPNDETIWDLSANALVEVYRVKEKSKGHSNV